MAMNNKGTPRINTVTRNSLTVQLPEGYMIFNTDTERYEEWDKDSRGWTAAGSPVSPDDGEIVVNADDLWDASTGLFPTPNIGGYQYTVGVAGTVDGRYYAVGEQIISNDDNASATDSTEWTIPTSIGTERSVEVVATQGQTMFPMPSQFVTESMRFTYDGYTVSYGSRLTVGGNNVTLPNLGFDLSAGDVVTFTYVEIGPI